MKTSRQLDYWNRNKEKLLEKRKLKRRIRDIPPKDFNNLVIVIVGLLKLNLRKKSQKEFLMDCLKELQNRFGLSVEYIRYLILSESYKNAIHLNYTSFGKNETKIEIERLKRLLKANNVKLTIQPVTYKRWTTMGCDYGRKRERRNLHFFKL
jgi:hypothetical protein